MLYSTEKALAPHSSTLPRKSRGRRSLGGCTPWGRQESDTTERLHFQFSLSCIGEGNGNPLQCSCQENPSDGGAWWAAVYGVAQSRTRLKRLSSSSSSSSSSMRYSSLTSIYFTHSSVCMPILLFQYTPPSPSQVCSCISIPALQICSSVPLGPYSFKAMKANVQFSSVIQSCPTICDPMN